jgi:hypothetical protein
MNKLFWVSGAVGKFEVAEDAILVGCLLGHRWVDTRM